MDARPEPPPEGVLIAAALKDARISVREAARRAGMSDGWWRQIVNGYQSLSGGAFGVVRAPAETLARMAQVVGLTPRQLADAGRDDAAPVLQEILRRERDPGPDDAPRAADAEGSVPVPGRRDTRRLPILYAGVDEARLAPFLEAVEAQVRAATPADGRRPSGREAFPESERYQQVWDTDLLGEAEKAKAIAIYMMIATEAARSA